VAKSGFIIAYRTLAMKDAKAWAERFRVEAEECRLISKLATNQAKRDTFPRLAAEADKNADALMMLMASGRLSEMDQE
jgi:hypothetical protein